MHYAWWLTHQNPADGVEVFTRSPRTKDMDPDEILEKLENYSNEGVRTYLEYLVLTQHSERAEYHTRLACSYVRDVQREIESNHQLEQMQNLVDQFKKHVNPTKMNENSKEEESNQVTFVGFLGSQKSPLIRLRLLLIRLLQSSQLYSPETLLTVLTKAGPLDIEKAIVFGRVS